MRDVGSENSVMRKNIQMYRFLPSCIHGALLFLLLSLALHGQKTDRSERNNHEFSSGYVESWKVDKTTRGVLLDDGAELKIGNERLTANRIIAWMNTVPSEENGNPIPESAELTRVYAEEDVLYWKEGEFLQADRLYLNLTKNTGIAENVTYRSYDKNRDVPVVVRADQLLQTGRGTYEATGVQFTTCDYADPHYSVYADTLSIWHSREDNETSVSASHLLPQFRGIPFGYWPFLYAHSDFDLGPLKRVEYGNNDRFGRFVKTLWGFEFSSVQRDEEGNVIRNKNGNKVYNYNVDLDVRVDYRERRGPAIGPELDYTLGRNHEGFFRGYLMDDLKGPNPDNDFDRQFLPQIKEHRGRAWWFHRYDLFGMEGDIHQLRLDTEVNNISDRHFMEEFFENEFKTGKSRETYTYLRHVNGNEFGSFLTRYRLNSFQTQTEYLPSLEYSVHGEPIEQTPLIYSSDTNLANVRRTRDRRSSLPDTESGRFDTYQEIAYPFSAGPVQARMFTGGRFTHYENDPATGNPINRHVLSGGAQLFDQLHRTYALSSDTLGLNGLRHIVSWDARYTNNFDSNRTPTSVPQFDTRDPVGEHEEIYFELRHRFETRSESSASKDRDASRSTVRSENNESENATSQNDKPERETGQNSFQFLNIGAAIEYYPNEERDRRRIREQNHLAPASWITSVRSPASGDVRDDNVSLLQLDFEFTPNLPVSLSGNYETNLEAHNLDASTTKLRFSPGEQVSASVKHSYIRQLTETIDTRLQTPLSDHWILSGTASYDLQQRESQDLQIGLGYRLHDFTIRFSAQFDDRRDDREFTISITPNFMDTNIFDYDVAEQ